jgi:hypothetical protein
VPVVWRKAARYSGVSVEAMLQTSLKRLHSQGGLTQEQFRSHLSRSGDAAGLAAGNLRFRSARNFRFLWSCAAVIRLWLFSGGIPARAVRRRTTGF